MSTTVDVAWESLGRLPRENGLKVKILVLLVDPDEPPAEVVLVTEVGSQLVEHRRSLARSITKEEPSRWVINGYGDDDPTYPIEVSGGCSSCGGGRLTILDPLPGTTRRRVRYPVWLEET